MNTDRIWYDDPAPHEHGSAISPGEARECVRVFDLRKATDLVSIWYHHVDGKPQGLVFPANCSAPVQGNYVDREGVMKSYSGMKH